MDLFENDFRKQILLTKIVIENYRNIPYLEIRPKENGLVLEGKNGVGKSNVLEAIYWAITDKLFTGVSKSELQNITPTNSDKGIKTQVELTFNNNYIFAKTFYEKYNQDGELSSRETVFSINGGVVKTNRQALYNLYDYLGLQDTINEFSKSKHLGNIDLASLIYNTNYLKQVDYKDIRALIIDMTGEVSPENIIKNNIKYKKLEQPFYENNKDLEALKERLRVEKSGNSRTNYNGLQFDIQSLSNTISEFAGKANEIERNYYAINISQVENDIKEIEDEISVLSDKNNSDILIKDLENQVLKLENELYKEQAKLQELHDQEQAKQNNGDNSYFIDGLRQDIRSLENTIYDFGRAINEIENEIRRKESDIFVKENKITTTKENIKHLSSEWQKLKNPSNSETLTCPKCNQVFYLNETKEHLDIINAELEKINLKGKQEKDVLDQLTEGIETNNKELKILNENLEKNKNERTKQENELEPLKNQLNDLLKIDAERTKTSLKAVLDNETTNNLNAKIKALKNDILNLEQNQNNDFNTKIENLKEQKLELQKFLDSRLIAEKYKEDIEGFIAKKEGLIERLNEVEQLLFLTKEVEREMLSETENRVADKFGENFKIELFKINITNNTIDSRVCNILAKDIHDNFININNINTGDYPRVALNFIKAVKTHYNILPSFVFVDELSSLDYLHQKQLFNLGEQVFATRVGASQETLTVIEL